MPTHPDGDNTESLTGAADDVAAADSHDQQQPAAHTQTSTDEGGGVETATDAPGRSWKRLLAYGVVPGLALVLTLASGYLKWQDGSVRAAQEAAVESVRAASDITVLLLSYRPDTVDKDLNAAQNRLSGKFRGDYAQLVNDVVIPGAKQKQISATAAVAAAASVSANENHAVVLLFVNQTIVVGNDAPTNTASSVRITLDKVHNQWLISQFDPV